ncbi:MAG TPA: DUF4198 domain-containing protein [Thermoanaerobaculia bacterium]|nr:DUF4198 domain-containing protein [Thermoanaerobaculia bacterium]
MLRFLTLLLLISCVAVNTAAHDFWLEPSSFHPGGGAPVTIRLMVGDQLDGEPVRRNNPRIERFVIRDSHGEKPVPGKHGADPAGYVEAISGDAMIGYRTTPVRHGNMPAQQFESYLREEGLERIIALRADSGASARAGREIYSRSAKVWLDSRAEGARFDEPFGFRLEIVPETDPGAPSPLRALLLFEGRPVEGALVSAVHRDSRKTVRLRSDRDGRVVLPIDQDGVWLVKAVHMIAAPRDAGADWESIWATLTFQKRP